MKLAKAWLTAAAMVTLTGTAQAALVNLGNGTVKDTGTNLIWLQNWNANGEANWNAQTTWAESTLDGFAGSNDWHLPTLQQFSDLFAAYGSLDSNLLPFTAVAAEYWTSTEFGAGTSAAVFRTHAGVDVIDSKYLVYFAVAVRTGDVTASVPEPETVALVLSALGAAWVARRRRPGA